MNYESPVISPKLHSLKYLTKNKQKTLQKKIKIIEINLSWLSHVSIRVLLTSWVIVQKLTTTAYFVKAEIYWTLRPTRDEDLTQRKIKKKPPRLKMIKRSPHSFYPLGSNFKLLLCFFTLLFLIDMYLVDHGCANEVKEKKYFHFLCDSLI